MLVARSHLSFDVANNQSSQLAAAERSISSITLRKLPPHVPAIMTIVMAADVV